MRLLTFLPGTPLALLNPFPKGLVHELGRFLARFSKSFADFQHPSLIRTFRWDMTQLLTLRPYLADLVSSRETLILREFERFERLTKPALAQVPQAALHNDANDHNLLVGQPNGACRFGIIDFGDMIQGPRICELAIATTYLMLGREAPAELAKTLIQAYQEVFPLERNELDCLVPAIRARLCASILISSHDQKREPGNEYVSISREPAWRLFEFLDSPEGQSFESDLLKIIA